MFFYDLKIKHGNQQETNYTGELKEGCNEMSIKQHGNAIDHELEDKVLEQFLEKAKEESKNYQFEDTIKAVAVVTETETTFTFEE